MCVILTPPSNDTPPVSAQECCTVAHCVSTQTLKTIADGLVGRPCYVDWPFLVEALVVSVSDAEGK